MSAEPSLLFPPFRLELGNERLWRGAQATGLRPKTFAVLRYLVTHPGQLVTKEVVLDAVWPNTYVSDTLLKDSIHELRKALGDNPRAPRFIETVHRRGYRFIAPLTTAPPIQSLESRVQSPSPAPSTQHPAPTLMGREAELEHLHQWLEKVLAEEQQVVFVTEEPGIGETTMVDVFLEQVATTERVWRLRFLRTSGR